jgi:hypothetical protein
MVLGTKGARHFAGIFMTKELHYIARSCDFGRQLSHMREKCKTWN